MGRNRESKHKVGRNRESKHKVGRNRECKHKVGRNRECKDKVLKIKECKFGGGREGVLRLHNVNKIRIHRNDKREMAIEGSKDEVGGYRKRICTRE